MKYCRIKDNIEEGTDSNQVVPWWSFGKTVLASAILKLVEENKLDLKGKYFSNEASLFQVLRHEAGYGEYAYGNPYQRAVDENQEPWSFNEMLKFTDNNQLIFKPATNWRYSNIGYYHLKVLIEETTELSISKALNKLLFYPIGIHDVRVAENKDDLLECDYIREGYHPKWLYHGLIIGSLKSACQFLDKLAQGKVLSFKMLEIMQMTYRLHLDMHNRPWKNPGYGLGLMIDDSSDENYSYGHTGMGPDSVISIFHFPRTSPPVTIGVVINTNDQSLVENQLVSLRE